MFSKNSPYTRETILKRSTEYVFRKNPDHSVVLLNLNDDTEFFKITGVAAKIWNLVDDQATLGSILDKIEAQHEVPKEKLYQDTEAFLQKLSSLKIIA